MPNQHSRTAEEKAEKKEQLVAGLVASQTAEYPEGVVSTAAEFAHLPKSTALSWVKADDENFKAMRREYKRVFVGKGSVILDHMLEQLYQKMLDPEQIKKVPVDKMVWSVGTLFDKIALASGEHEASAVNALLAGVALGRAVERGRQAPADGSSGEQRETRGEVIVAEYSID